MKPIEIAPSEVYGTIAAIPSKSYAHRILIASALSDAPTAVECRVSSEDIDATADCLRAAGARISYNAGIFNVIPSPPPEKGLFDCRESGSTLRFMLPVAAVLGISASFTGRGRLPERPLAELLKTLNEGGVKASSDNLPLSINGKLGAGRYSVSSGESSQFMSGMLLALSRADGESFLAPAGEKVSSGYIDITADVLKKFGCELNPSEKGYHIKGGALHSPVRICVEGDWSNAAFMLAAGALTGRVAVTGLNSDSRQGDKAIISILEEMGAIITRDKDAIICSRSELEGVCVDLTDMPDLAPVTAVLAAFARGKSVLTGMQRLRAKESDRLRAVTCMLSSLRIEWQTDGNSLTVFGGNPHAGLIETFADHRLVMAGTVAGLACGARLNDAAPAAKSYPDFLSDIRSIGGKIYEDIR